MRPRTMPEITPALPADAAALALLLTLDPDSAAASPLQPPPPRGEGWGGGQPGNDLLNHLRRRIALGGVRIARLDGRPAGFIDRTDEEIHALYIAPAARRHGLGRALVAEAKEAAPRLTLWILQANTPARAFWAAQGFAEAEITTGQNDKALPNIRLIWNGAA